MCHEQLRVYQELLQVVREVYGHIRCWPRGWGYLTDQLQRALSSAVLNLVEGNMRRSAVERRRFFEIARGSVAESAAALDLAAGFGLLLPDQVTILKGSLSHAAAVLRKL